MLELGETAVRVYVEARHQVEAVRARKGLPEASAYTCRQLEELAILVHQRDRFELAPAGSAPDPERVRDWVAASSSLATRIRRLEEVLGLTLKGEQVTVAEAKMAERQPEAPTGPWEAFRAMQ